MSKIALAYWPILKLDIDHSSQRTMVLLSKYAQSIVRRMNDTKTRENRDNCDTSDGYSEQRELSP